MVMDCKRALALLNAGPPDGAAGPEVELAAEHVLSCERGCGASLESAARDLERVMSALAAPEPTNGQWATAERRILESVGQRGRDRPASGVALADAASRAATIWSSAGWLVRVAAAAAVLAALVLGYSRLDSPSRPAAAARAEALIAPTNDCEVLVVKTDPKYLPRRIEPEGDDGILVIFIEPKIGQASGLNDG